MNSKDLQKRQSLKGKPKPRKERPEEQDFSIGGLIREARQERGMTQEELALRVGTTKSYISKIEKNVKEVRLSTLQRIVEEGLGGELKLSIKI